MDDTALNLAAYFQAASPEAWREAAEQTLKGRPLDKLTHRTLEGVPIHPLYSALPEDGAVSLQRSRRGWDVRAIYDAGDAARCAEAVEAAGQRGVTSAWLVLAVDNAPGLALKGVEDLKRVTAAALTGGTRVVLDPGPHGAAWVACALAASRDGVVVEVHVDPIGTLAKHGVLAQGLVGAWDGLAEAITSTRASAPGMRLVGLSGLPYHNAGAHAAQELAMILAAGVEALRQLERRGVSPREVAARSALQVAVGSHMFMEIAKLRVARTLWTRILAACGVEEPPEAFIHACTSPIAQTQRDPWVNMLRATVGCFSAGVAGADAVTALPFDRALGESDALAQRLATNTPIVLEAESHLARVTDPSQGSWFLESLTTSLTDETWRLFQQIEAEGGMAASLTSGSVVAQIAATAEARDRDIARRKAPLLGVSEYANVDEVLPSRAQPAATPREVESITLAVEHPGGRFGAAVEAALGGASAASLTAALHPGAEPTRIEPLPTRRLAQGWERLRDASDAHKEATGHRPRVFLANLGAVPEHKARAAFAARLFEAGGFTCIGNDGVTDAADAARAFAASGAEGAVICGTDAAYASQASAVAEALAAHQPVFIALAGRPGDYGGVTHHVHIGCDALGIMTDLQTRSMGGSR